MAEAIFAKYSKSAGSGGGIIDSSSLVSNATKAGLGLPNSATLDHVIQSLAFRSDTMATIIVTVKDVDGTVVPNANVWMNVPSGAGTNLAYMTDESGTCMFKTNAGTANFSDHAYDGYVDVDSQSNVKVDCPVGSVKSITLQRTRRYNNGDIVGSYGGGDTLSFSPFAGTVDITCTGGSGAGGYCSTILNPNATIAPLDNIPVVDSYGGAIVNNFYWYQPGFSTSTRFHFFIKQNTTLHLNAINNISGVNICTYLPGCNGKAGSTVRRNGVNICGKSGSIGGGWSGTTNLNINANHVGQINRMHCSWSSNHSGYITYMDDRTNNIIPRLNSLTNLTTARRANGATGTTASAFGVSAAGGIGGYSIPNLFGPQDATYNARITDTGGGKGGTVATMNTSFRLRGNVSYNTNGKVKGITNINTWINMKFMFEAGKPGRAADVYITNFRYCK